MSTFAPSNSSSIIVQNENNLSIFQEKLRQKCQEQMRERGGQLFNQRRLGLLSSEDVQETLIEIVRQEFNKLATSQKSEKTISTKPILNLPLNLDEALQEESYLIAEQEQWILQEYERLMSSEEQMFDMLEADVCCPICQKVYLEEIPDFIVCNYCGLKIRTDISLKKFKQELEFYVNKHSERCLAVPNFSLVYDRDDTSFCISCLHCSSYFLLKTTNVI